MWYDEHLAWCRERGLRASTIYGRERILIRFGATLRCDPRLATHADIRGWWQTRQHLAPQTRATELANVRAFYRWCVLEALRDDDPTGRIVRPRLRQPLPRPISEADLTLAIRFADERVRAWLLLAAYAGLRAGEIAGLRTEHLYELDDGPAVLVADGKSIRQRLVPLHPVVREALPPVRRGWLFPRADGQPGPNAPWRVSQVANRQLHELGIAATLHQLRHRFLSKVYQESLDLRMTQDLAGHTSPETTARYAAWTPGAARRAVLALD